MRETDGVERDGEGEREREREWREGGKTERDSGCVRTLLLTMPKYRSCK